MLKTYRLQSLALVLMLGLCLPLVAQSAVKQPVGIEYIEQAITQHPGQSATYVLDKGADALMTRAWLADNARHSIEIQYFIWSEDNIGILAMESMLRAAERGVQLRVLIDDITIETPDKTLLALAKHPNIHIRIYNPKSNVGVPIYVRMWNAVTHFRSFNQRMHDKTFIVDGKVGITGGRNMAEEYYDYDHTYNFRDRDVLLMGYVVNAMENSFDRFWNSDLVEPVEVLFDGIGLMQKHVQVTDDEVQSVYKWLHDYAQLDSNYDPMVRQTIANLPAKFPLLVDKMIWGQVRFISDDPGKNEKQFALTGGGRSSREVLRLLREAHSEVFIQSPYLVLTKEAKNEFRELIKRGVKIRISTNSLASTDHVYAFSGYLKQRKALLDMGVEIYEYKPHPENQRQLMLRYHQIGYRNPIFAIHAKTIVVDSRILFIGTFNLDPRSVNLNTEVGVLIYQPAVAEEVAEAIREDMAPQNSWNAATDKPDKYNSLRKRMSAAFWSLMPIKSLL